MSADDWLQQLAAAKRAEAQAAGVPVGHPTVWKEEMREECKRLQSQQVITDFAGLL